MAWSSPPSPSVWAPDAQLWTILSGVVDLTLHVHAGPAHILREEHAEVLSRTTVCVHPASRRGCEPTHCKLQGTLRDHSRAGVVMVRRPCRRRAEVRARQRGLAASCHGTRIKSLCAQHPLNKRGVFPVRTPVSTRLQCVALNARDMGTPAWGCVVTPARQLPKEWSWKPAVMSSSYWTLRGSWASHDPGV